MISFLSLQIPESHKKFYRIRDIGGAAEIACSISPLKPEMPFFRFQTDSFSMFSLTCHLLVPGRYQVRRRYLLIAGWVHEQASESSPFYSLSKCHYTCFLCDFFRPSLLSLHKQTSISHISPWLLSRLPKTPKNIYTCIYEFTYVNYYKYVHILRLGNLSLNITNQLDC